MRLDANDPLLGVRPEEFLSPFPSDASLLDKKFTAVLKGVDPLSPNAESLGSRLMSEAQANAWRVAQAMANAKKVTTVGDIPSAWLPEVAYFHEVRPGVDALAGLWAQVTFPTTTTPEAYGIAVAEVGLDAALNYMGAVPLVGWLMKGILNLGNMLGSLFASPDPPEDKAVYLPWTLYSSKSDEQFVQDFIINTYFAGVDWTAMFLPPYELGVPWSVSQGVDQNGRKLGQLWAPVKSGQIAYSGKIGAMPGTFHIAGHVQSPTLAQPDPRLLRYFGDGTLMHWGRALTDVGEFYPATAQTCTLAWQQAQRDGSPDMYKVDAAKVEKAWREYFDQFFDSLWFGFQEDEWIGEFAAPYLAVQGAELRLGLRDHLAALHAPLLQRPHPAPLITPTIFTTGAGTPATRNACLYLESASGPLGKAKGVSSGGSLAVPYKRDDRGRAVASGGAAWPANKPLPKGAVCIPWPSGEELLAKYSRPDDAFTTPAAKRLAERQRWCLKHTLVSAYVRCDGPTAYTAFKADPELAALCRDMRDKLLQDDARFMVRLADVADIDPAFEARLRKAGVSNSPQQMAQQLGLATAARAKAEADAAEDPAPPALPPAGGVPFDIAPPPARKGRDDTPRIPAGAAALGAAGLAYLAYRAAQH